jgi:parallel beta-helix repeat protein
MRLYPLRLSILAALLTLLALSLSGAPGVARAGGTVTNCVWSGPGGLQEALAGGGAVTFACDGTIIVPEIVIAVDTSLDATGHDVTLSGNNLNRVVYVNSGVSLSITGLTVADGYVTPGDGGGLYNNGGTVDIVNSVFNGNAVPDSDSIYYRGGGVFNTNSGTVTVTNSTFSNNAADTGGGIHNDSSDSVVIFEDSIMSENIAYYGGGGIYNDFGSVMVTNSSFSGNNGHYGGGIYNCQGSLTVTNSTFSDNTGYSGGIMSQSGPVTVTNSTISGSNGSGISTYGGLLTVTDSTISGNTAESESGGGISIHGSDATITNSTISGNTAEYDGGGFYIGIGNVTITNSTISDNTAGRDGGGIFETGYDCRDCWSHVTITASTISGNTTTLDGGGIFSGDYGEITITNSTLSGNTAGRGGGIYNDSVVTITNSTLSGNTAEEGGGIVSGYALVTITNSLIAAGLSGGNCYSTAYNSIVDDGGNYSNDGTCGFGADHDNVDPLLEPLADNGGPTLTHALQTGSPALGGGNPAVCAADPVNGLDQRSEPRPQPAGEHCDSGALESSLPAPSTHPPDAINDRVSGVPEDSVDYLIDVLANDLDPDDDPLQLVGVTSPSHGNTTIFDNGTPGDFADDRIAYTPVSNYDRTDSFTYTISDGTGFFDTATVFVSISSLPDDPVGVDDTYDTHEDTQLNVTAEDGVLANDTDPDLPSDWLRVSAFDNPTAQGGTVSVDQYGAFTYDPPAGYAGLDSFGYTVRDSTGRTNTATVTIDVLPAPSDPLAEDDTYSTFEDTPLSVDAENGVLANDTDPDLPYGDSLSADAYSGTTAHGGSVTLNPDGSFTYNPFTDWYGQDSFSYMLRDSTGRTDQGTVTITVDTFRPAAPTLLAPGHKTTLNTTTPTLAWEAVALAASYEVQIATDVDFVRRVRRATVAETNYTTDPLHDGQMYWWRVRGVNAGGESGPWSVARSFKIDTSAPPRPPRLTPPAGATISDPTPAFRWARNVESVGYVFQLAADEVFEIVLIEESLVRPRYDVSAPLLPGQYWWRVAAVDAAGNVSEWSAASFTLVVDAITTPPPTEPPPTDVPPTDVPPTAAPPVLITPVPTQPPPPHKPGDPTPTPELPGDGKTRPPHTRSR